MANKADYSPNFKRDPKEIRESYLEKLDVASEKISQAGPLNRVESDPLPLDPEDIKGMEDLARTFPNITDKYNKVNDRAEKLEENLGDFEPIPLPEDLHEDARIIQANTADLTKAPMFTPPMADCITKILDSPSDGYDKMDTKIIDNPNTINKEVNKHFPKWGNMFIIILFWMFFKGIVWQLLTILCRSFRKIKIKIGFWKICIGCPFAKLFKSLVKLLNGGKDWSINDDGKRVRWGYCPPDFDPNTFIPINTVTNAMRGNGLANEDTPQSICESNAEPNAMEISAAKNISRHILKNGITNPTTNNMKAANYLNFKARSNAYRSQLNSMYRNLAQSADPKGTVLKHHVNKKIVQVSGDINKAIEDYGLNKPIDEATKGLLKLSLGLLKVWDALTSATNMNVNTNRLKSAMICCFLNIFGAMFPALDITTKAGIGKIVNVIEVFKTLIDMELDDMSIAFSAEYFTLKDLQGMIKDALVRTAVSILTPIVNGLCQEVTDLFNPDKIREKLQDTIDENQNSLGIDSDKLDDQTKFMKAVTECELMDHFSAFINCKVGSLQTMVMSWLLGLKGQSDIVTRKVEFQMKISARSKMLHSLKLIFNGIIESLEKNIQFIISVCDDKGNVSPVQVQQLTEQLDSELFKDEIVDLGDPVFGPYSSEGIESNDDVDAAFTNGTFFEPIYSNMPGYANQNDAGSTVESRAVSSNAKEDIESNSQPKSGSSSEASPVLRDCGDTDFLKQLFKELKDTHNVNTLFEQ